MFNFYKHVNRKKLLNFVKKNELNNINIAKLIINIIIKHYQLFDNDVE